MKYLKFFYVNVFFLVLPKNKKKKKSDVSKIANSLPKRDGQHLGESVSILYLNIIPGIPVGKKRRPPPPPLEINQLRSSRVLTKTLNRRDSVMPRLSAECFSDRQTLHFMRLSRTTGTHNDIILVQLLYPKRAEGKEGRRDNSAFFIFYFFFGRERELVYI